MTTTIDDHPGNLAGDTGAAAATIRYQLRATLTTTSALHIGDARDAAQDVENCLPVVRRGSHRPFVPGTSLAGALRAWYRDVYGASAAAAVFGSPDAASLLDVEDCVFAAPQPTRGGDGAERDGVLERASVGIDRSTATASPGVLFTREVLPAGSTADVRILARPRLDTEAGAARIALWRINHALHAGEIRLGAATTRGLGGIRTDAGHIEIYDLATLEGIADWLAGTGTPDRDPGDTRRVRPILSVTIGWQPAAAMLVGFTPRARADDAAAPTETADAAVPQPPGRSPKLKFDQDERAVDIATPLIEPRAGDRVDVYHPLIPGSSIKGVLRAWAGRIARTVLAEPAACATGTDPRTLADYLDSEPDLVTLLFGSTEQRGAVSVHDCYANHSINAGVAARLRVAGEHDLESNERNALDGLGQAKNHIAIDRWSGAVAHGRLFRILPVQRADKGWQPIVLTLDVQRLSRLGTPAARAALCLLSLTLAEFAAGILPLGSRTTRGLGAVTVQSLSITGDAVAADDWTRSWHTSLADPNIPAALLAHARARQPDGGWAHHLHSQSSNAADTGEDQR